MSSGEADQTADNGQSHDMQDHEQRNDAAGQSETEAGEKKRPLFRRPLFWIILIGILAVLLIAGRLYYAHARKYESTDDAFIDAHIVRLQPQISGQLIWVAPSDNKHVTAGQLLAKIRPYGPAAQLAQAQAGISEADASIQQALGRLTAARAQVRQAQANAAAPEADARTAARDLARYEKLQSIDSSAVAATQLDQARAKAQSTAAQAQAARRQVESAKADVVVAQRGVSAAQAQKSAAEARVREANVTVGDLEIRAPISGQVVNRSVNVGSTVSPATQMMAIVPDNIWVTANFKETQITHMKRGDPVDIKVDAFPDLKFHGHVDSFQRGAGQAFALLPPQNATGNFVKVVQRVPVRIVFDRKDDGADWMKYPLGPGMSVEPTVKVR
ncbi:HlyD family secretion protein [Stakelama sediminis]|uniref:Membrane fusion protein (Multidrug efflux system) n=1 Tax=Stakelama sediminis TaxID=463200 RepID=A0A840YY86_9SPHN|nr:HlyD family secretion protein [Stakelama sediminis]MBB5718731.1 membrane fusion protein (multidrug efflux system) [Stakelama sediminis]